MEGTKTKRILVIFYSMYGHVETLAKEIKEGLDSVQGVKAELWRLPETLPEEVLKKMYAKTHTDEIPVLTYDKLSELETADGFLFGFPTRFGMMPSQVKSFFDSTGGLWFKGALAGKPAGLFFSTSSQGGGQETTALTSITVLAHHGMIYVPLGYTFGPDLSTTTEVKGGSPYGAGTLSGADGKRTPSELELKIARYQGEQFGKFSVRLN